MRKLIRPFLACGAVLAVIGVAVSLISAQGIVLDLYVPAAPMRERADLVRKDIVEGYLKPTPRNPYKFSTAFAAAAMRPMRERCIAPAGAGPCSQTLLDRGQLDPRGGSFVNDGAEIEGTFPAIVNGAKADLAVTFPAHMDVSAADDGQMLRISLATPLTMRLDTPLLGLEGPMSLTGVTVAPEEMVIALTRQSDGTLLRLHLTFSESRQARLGVWPRLVAYAVATEVRQWGR